MELKYVREKELRDRSSYLFWADFQTCVGKQNTASPHIHNDIEIIYATSGEFDIFLNGNRSSMKKGDLLIINAREVHQTVGISDGENSYIVVKFSPELVYSAEQSAFEIRYVLPFMLGSAANQKIISESIIGTSCVPSAMKEILDENLNKAYGFELAVKVNICRIFLWILRYWYKSGMNLNIDICSRNHSAKQISKVFTFISENYAYDITVTKMAELCNMSYSYFSKVFKDITGQNFSEYVNFVRVREAERLLATTELTVTEIAYSTGFSSSSYFVCKFRELKGITPKQFRKLFSLEASALAD